MQRVTVPQWNSDKRKYNAKNSQNFWNNKGKSAPIDAERGSMYSGCCRIRREHHHGFHQSTSPRPSSTAVAYKMTTKVTHLQRARAYCNKRAHITTSTCAASWWPHTAHDRIKVHKMFFCCVFWVQITIGRMSISSYALTIWLRVTRQRKRATAVESACAKQ